MLSTSIGKENLWKKNQIWRKICIVVVVLSSMHVLSLEVQYENVLLVVRVLCIFGAFCILYFWCVVCF